MLQMIAIGHLGADAEFKNENGKEFTVFRIANTDKWTSDDGVVHQNTTWVDCIMSGKPNVLKYLKQGQQVYVSGSVVLRVYSSAKDKCMKAGVTINVRQVELLGGKSDDIPSLLYTEDGGVEVQIGKYYYAGSMKRGDDAPENVTLVSRKNERFIVNRSGWVSKIEENPE